MGFLLRLQPHRLPELRRCFLAECEGRLVGLVYVVPVPQRRGWFIEHMARAPFAPNGTVELLVDTVMRWASEQGCSWLTLGLVPLSGDVPPLLRIVRRRMSFLYNFDGLRHFKAKLRPTTWQPIYLSYPASQNVIGTVFDVLAAFAKSGPQSKPRFGCRPT
jgi:phosphatidylglycerol lysyltransferase